MFCGAERGAGRRHQRGRVLGRGLDQKNDHAQDQASLREEQRRHQNRAKRAVVRRADAGQAGQADDHRRGAADAVGRPSQRPRGHSSGRQ